MPRQTGPVRHPLPPPGDPYDRPAVSPNDELDPTLDDLRTAFVSAIGTPPIAELADFLEAFDRIRDDRRELLVDLEVLNLDPDPRLSPDALERAFLEAKALRDESTGDRGALTRPIPNPDGPPRPSNVNAAPGPTG